MQMLITLEPLGLFCSNFVYLCILTLSSQWTGMKKVTRPQRASFCPVELFCPSVILQSAKTLITLESHRILC